MKLRILIAGGGIGGLTAALCCAQQNVQVVVLERAAEFVESGAGIQLSPNATRVLHSLGLETPLKKHVFIPQGTQFRHWRTGKTISEYVLGDAAVTKFGSPYYHIHRGDLLRVLVDAVSDHPNIELQSSTAISHFSQNLTSVNLSTNKGSYQGDALIGADGIHSAVRAELWGKEHAVFTGNVAWRALVPTERISAGLVRPMSTAWWGPGKHFVHYFVRGGTFVNCVCVVEKKGWEVESWTTPGEYAELKSDFAGWHENIAQLIDSADRATLYKWALYDRLPMSRWGKARVTLLGDACHPTLPFMAQGAAMAIEDGAVLAACLNEEPAVTDALTLYENLRRARTADIQNGSRRNAKIFHFSGIQAWLRNRVARRAGGRTMDKLYSYDALNATGKGSVRKPFR